MKAIAILVTLVFQVPLYYYFIYRILLHIEATEVMWFLFYLYMPIAILGIVLSKAIEGK